MNGAIYWMSFSLGAIAFFMMLTYAAGVLRKRTKEHNQYCPYCLGIGYYHDTSSGEDMFCECSDEYRIYKSDATDKYGLGASKLNGSREMRGSLAWFYSRGKGGRR